MLLAGNRVAVARRRSRADRCRSIRFHPRPPHFPPKAKRVIFLYMSGGVSHVDSFDPKPKLFADAGKTVTVDEFQGRKGNFKHVPQAAAVDLLRRRANAARKSARCFRTSRSASMNCASFAR